MDRTLTARLERTRAHGACDYPSLGLARPAPSPAVAQAGAVAFVAARHGRVRVAALGLERAVEESELAAIEEEYRARGFDKLELTICSAASHSLPSLAHKRGYRLVEPEHVLIGRPVPVIAAAPPVELERLTAASAAIWARTLALATGEPAWALPERQVEHLEMLQHPQVEAWLARLQGEPVGGGAMLTEDGLTTLFCMGTVPEYRGRGVHRALLSARCARAAALGADAIAMAVEPGSASQRNLERHGFWLAHSATVLALPLTGR